MSIERQHGQMCITCDSCDESLEFFDQDQFDEMIADAKAHGWRIVNTDGTWRHNCGCEKQDKVSAARRMFGL